MKIEFRTYSVRTESLIDSEVIDTKDDISAIELSETIAKFLEKQDVCNVTVNSSEPKLYLKFNIVHMKDGLVYMEDKKYNRIFNYNDFKKDNEIKTRYLTYVDPEYNNNKYYQMIDNGDGKFKSIYGRIGCNENESFGKKEYYYPIYMYYLKYYEKIRKGYAVKDDLIENTEIKTVKSEKRYKEHENETCQKILSYLLNCSRQLIEENYSVSPVNVSKKMIEEAKKYVDKLGKYKTVKSFNNCLIELFKTLPRKMNNVKNYLAKGTKDLKRVYEREYDLLNNMIIIVESDTEKTIDNQKAIDESFNFNIELGNENDIKKVKKLLNKDLADKVSNVFIVKNDLTDERFINTCAADKNPGTKMLWHGSGTENWLSIMSKGLLLNPNAQITGKMFGQGIYFAPSAQKSWGYTSGRGSYWRGGKEIISYMGLFETEYGNPLDVYDYSNNGYATYKSFKDANPDKQCLHAHGGGTYLRNDEIIFYKESQVTMRYLVEFTEKD